MLHLTHDKVFYTLQGEGRYTGVPSVFVRLTGCNLRCAWKEADGGLTKCDTPYSSFEPEKSSYKIEDIIQQVLAFNCLHVVITGGEPFLQPKLAELVQKLEAQGKLCTLETNGTRYFPTQASFISLSPKFLSSTAYQDFPEREDDQALFQFIRNHDCQLKFVMHESSDLEEVLKLKDKMLKAELKTETEFNQMVWLMAQGISAQQLDQKALWVTELCKKYQWNYSDRMHIKLWGDQRQL